MAVVLECGDNPNETKSYTLEGIGFDFRFRWNTRSECWHCYIGRKGQAPACKIKLVTGTNLLKPFEYSPNTPAGRLFLFDTLKTYGKAGRDDLGIDKRFKLVYIRSNEEV